MKSVVAAADLCGALFEFDLGKLDADWAHLQFIDLEPSRTLWLEMQVSPHKLIEASDAELPTLDFLTLFLVKGGIKFGWFQRDETNTVDVDNQPTFFRNFLQVVIKKWYDE